MGNNKQKINGNGNNRCKCRAQKCCKKFNLMLDFDRLFGNSERILGQGVVILIIISLLVILIGLVGWIFTGDSLRSVFIQAVGLAFGASDLPPGDAQTFPKWWQVLAFLMGALLFSGVTITYVGNFLGNRQEAYRNGSVRYLFKDHIIFFGGGEMIVPMLKQIHKDNALNKKNIVILTGRDVPEVRLSVLGKLSTEERKMDITFLRGRRDDAGELQSVHTKDAARLYIVGDDPMDEDHDSVNIACWNLARKQCSGREKMPCYLLLERASSEHIFLHNSKPMPKCFDTTVVNRLETVAQMVLVHNGTGQPEVPTLDRGGIGPDSERTVHLVLYGMTAFSYAMSTTAAHLCHFPNFVSISGEKGHERYGKNLQRRTRITLIAPNIKEEMNYLTSHLSRLFSLSKVTVNGTTTMPEDDFLDVEWEFVDGNIADGRIRELLRQYYADNQAGKTYLTLALCMKDARKNTAAALYLPDEFHRIVMKKGAIDYDTTIPIFVYQPDSEELMKMAHEEVPHYSNIFPIGSIRESYDPQIRQRISEGKRINYVYKHGTDWKGMTESLEELEKIWPDKYPKQRSNIYCANHIGIKKRSMNAEKTKSEILMKKMQIVEHNRWNMEELLMGYGAVPREDRIRLKQLELEGKTEECSQLKKELNTLRETEFLHNCIAPFDELLEEDRIYDRYIVDHIDEVTEKKNNEQNG